MPTSKEQREALQGLLPGNMTYSRDHLLSPTHRMVAEWHERVMPDATESQIVRKLMGETNELYEAFLDPSVSNLAEEAADVYIMLIALANKRGFDLDLTARAKHAVNLDRDWIVQPDGTYKHKR